MKFFITGSGTGVGKTYITCALIEEARKQGLKVKALKPVISGFSLTDPECDSLVILRALGKEATPENISMVSLYRFGAPLSPHLAAAKEGQEIDFHRLLEFSRSFSDELNIIEGAGGIMAPLTPKLTMLDWMQALRFPVILVVGSYLGAISHALTSVAVLQQKGLGIAMVVLSQSENEPNPLDETLETLKNFLFNIPVVAVRRNSKPQLLACLEV